MPWLCSLTGAAIKKPPIVVAIGGFPFHLRPCLAGASANRRLRCVPTPSRSSSCHTLSALRRESDMLAGTGGTEGYGWESGRLQIAAAPGAAKRGAGRNGISRRSGKRPTRSRPSAGDGARTGPSVRRPFRAVARGTRHSWDSPLRPPPLSCRLLLLSGRVHQRAVSRARAPWSVTPCIELSRRVPSMPSSKLMAPLSNMVRP